DTSAVVRVVVRAGETVGGRAGISAVGSAVGWGTRSGRCLAGRCGGRMGAAVFMARSGRRSGGSGRGQREAPARGATVEYWMLRRHKQIAQRRRRLGWPIGSKLSGGVAFASPLPRLCGGEG